MVNKNKNLNTSVDINKTMKGVMIGLLIGILSLLIGLNAVTAASSCDIMLSPSTLMDSDFTQQQNTAKVVVFGSATGSFSSSTKVTINCNSNNAKPEPLSKMNDARLTLSASELAYSGACYYPKSTSSSGTEYMITATVSDPYIPCLQSTGGAPILKTPASTTTSGTTTTSGSNGSSGSSTPNYGLVQGPTYGQETSSSGTNQPVSNPPTQNPPPATSPGAGSSSGSGSDSETPQDSTFTLILKPKASIFGLPYAESQLLSTSCGELKAYTYNSKNKKYIKIKLKDALTNPSEYKGRGIVARVPSECKAEFNGDYETEQTLELEAGWNLISFQMALTEDDSYETDCRTSSPFWRYDSGQGKYVEDKTWTAGEAYWVRVKSKCTMAMKKYFDENIPPPVPFAIKDLFKIK